MNKISIPKDEQFTALAKGLPSVYRLLESYVGNLENVPNFRSYITVTRGELSEFLEKNIKLAEQHIATPGAAHVDEFPVLDRSHTSFVVYEPYRGEKRYEKSFDRLPDAAAEFLMWGW